MKTVNLIIAFILLTTGCVFDGEHIAGSGNVIRNIHKVTSFNTLNLGVVFNVVIIPSDSEKVIVEADDNLQELVIVEKHDSILSIKMKPHLNIIKKSSGKIYVYIKGLVAITNESVGRLENEGVLKSGRIAINNQAVGKTKLKFESNDIIFNNSAVGKTELSGNCNNLKIKNSSVGEFNASELQCNYLDLENESVGKTSVFANKEMIINNSGIGSLDVYGHGIIKKISTTGIGSFKKH